MKFCLLNNLYPPNARGGAEVIVELLINGLLKAGHQVLLITSTPAGKYAKEKIGENLEILRINPKNIYYLLEDKNQSSFKKVIFHGYDFFNTTFSKIALAEIDAFKPDVVLTHNLKGIGLGIVRKLQRQNYFQIHTLHDFQLLDPHGSFWRAGVINPCQNIFYKAYRLFSRFFIGKPDVVIAPSQFILNKHKEFGFFQNSVTQAIFNPLSNLNNQEQSEKKINEIFTVLFLGQLTAHKGAEFLAETFKKFICPNAELLIVGGGEQLPLMKDLAKLDSRLKILGQIDHDKLTEIFQKTDLLVVPTLSLDNSPTVIYEAYSFSVPVLVSDSGGSKELVKENETGWVFKSGDENDLLAKLQQVFNEREKLPILGKNGQKFVKDLTIDHYLERMLVLCRNSIKSQLN